MTSGVAKVTISLPMELLEGIDAEATKQSKPRSTLITAMLSASVARTKIDGPPGVVALRDAIAQAEEHGASKAATILRMALARQEAT
jgi:metal-responsive CopG/Arc/MetJ family transcriptional regulator